MSAEDPYAPFEAACINGDISMTCRYYNGITRSPVHARVVLSQGQTQILIDELVKSLLDSKKHVAKKPSFIPDEFLEEEEGLIIPYKSLKQAAKFHELLKEGKISKEVVDEWDAASKGKKLPDRVKPKKGEPITRLAKRESKKK